MPEASSGIVDTGPASQLYKHCVIAADRKRLAEILLLMQDTYQSASCRYLQGWTFMSCEGPMKGLRKPDPKCWEVAQEYLGAEASQLVLIDDRQENCESARKAGLHAIHSRDANSTRSQLVELSVLKEV